MDEKTLEHINKQRAADFLPPLIETSVEFILEQNAKIDAHQPQNETDQEAT